MIDDYDKKRAEVFFKKSIKVHISKKNGEWFNGIITEISNDFFIIRDQLKGNKLILFSELKKPIEFFRESEK